MPGRDGDTNDDMFCLCCYGGQPVSSDGRCGECGTILQEIWGRPFRDDGPNVEDVDDIIEWARRTAPDVADQIRVEAVKQMDARRRWFEDAHTIRGKPRHMDERQAMDILWLQWFSAHIDMLVDYSEGNILHNLTPMRRMVMHDELESDLMPDLKNQLRRESQTHMLNVVMGRDMAAGADSVGIRG